jgi:predicted Zn-dependent peptidase
LLLVVALVVVGAVEEAEVLEVIEQALFQLPQETTQ